MTHCDVEHVEKFWTFDFQKMCEMANQVFCKKTWNLKNKIYKQIGFFNNKDWDSNIQPAQGKVLPREKFYLEKKSTPEKVYPGKNPQFWSNQADIGET